MSFYLSARQRGNDMLLRSFENGERKQYRVKYKPYLFVPDENGDYRSIYDKPVSKLDFDSISDAREFTKKYEDISGFEFYGMTSWVYPFLNDKFPGKIQYDRKHINVVSTDIETMADDGFPDPEKADKAITAITLSDGTDYIFLSIKEYKPHIPNVKVIRCQSEEELLGRFVEEWIKMDPDIVTGWNVEKFDIIYLVNRIRNLIGKEQMKRLSPWGIIKEDRDREGVLQGYDIYGVAVMDYMLVYKKWTRTTQESYTLDNIANVELGLGKVNYKDEYGSLHGLYEQNFQLYAEYNIRDTEIINQLDEKLKLMDLALALAYDAKLNYIDAYTSVKMWDVITHNYLMEKKIVIPQYKNSNEDFEFVGGYVKDPLVGNHKWVCSFDLNSLYPMLIQQYNISPETFLGQKPGGSVDKALNGEYRSFSKHLKDKNITVTPNYCFYTRSKRGFLPELMDEMYVDRARVKKEMLEEESKYEETKNPKHKEAAVRLDMTQLAKKIQLNCAYGALGNPWFRYFNVKFAESVTVAGQLSTRWIIRSINRFLNKKFKTEDVDYVIAADTDSIYLNMERAVELKYGENLPDDVEVVDFLDNLCDKLVEPFISGSFQDLALYSNAYEQKMYMKREAISSKGIWTGKKHYILNVYDNEGVRYTEPKLKVTGIEAVRSSTPSSCREKIKDALNIIMNGTEDELKEFVADFEKEFHELPYEKVAFPRSLNGMEKYRSGKGWKKGTPIAVRGALVHNRLVNEMGLTNEIAKLQDGDKIKFCYLKLPNPTRENIISCFDELPEQFELKKYIDYDTQFEKAFKHPLKSITDVVGWELEHFATLF